MKAAANALLMIAMLTACGPITAVEDTPVGLWTMVSFNGSSLPMILAYPDGTASTVQLMGGRLLLVRDRTCTQSSDVRRVVEGVVIDERTDAFPCTWRRTGEALEFDFGQGYATSGAWEGDLIVEQMPNDPPTASTRERVWTR